MPVTSPSQVLHTPFPPAVRAAQVSLATDHKLWTIQGRVLRLAQIFATHTPLLDLAAPVTCSRAKAAELLDVNVKTISRYVNQLQKFGLIERVKQKYKKDKGWECFRFVWTSYGQSLFSDFEKNLPFKKALSADSEIKSTATSSQDAFKNNQSVVPYMKRNNATAFTEQPADASRGTILSHRPQALKNNNLLTVNKPALGNVEKKQVARRVDGIPSDMVDFARRLELDGKKVSVLFRFCTQHGQWLQDLLFVEIEKMEKKSIKGGSAMGFIHDLLAQGTDYRRLAQAKLEKEALQQKLAIEKARLKDLEQSIKPGQRLAGGIVDVVANGVVCFIDPITGNQAGTTRVLDLVTSPHQYTDGVEKHENLEAKSSHLLPFSTENPHSVSTKTSEDIPVAIAELAKIREKLKTGEKSKPDKPLRVLTPKIPLLKNQPGQQKRKLSAAGTRLSVKILVNGRTTIH